MAKDPAFLFYSQDFFTGVSDLSFEDRGKFITLLCLMHQKGRINEETIRFLVGSVSDNLKSKFGIDEKGLWFNKRLEFETARRNNFTKSRQDNGSKGGRPKKNKPLAKPTVNHTGKRMGNEIEIVIVNGIKNTNERNFENFEKWSEDLLSDHIFEQMLMKENFNFTAEGLQKAIQGHLELFARYPNMNPQTVGEFRHSVIYHIKQKLEEHKSKLNGKSKNKWDINEIYAAAKSDS